MRLGAGTRQPAEQRRQVHRAGRADHRAGAERRAPTVIRCSDNGIGIPPDSCCRASSRCSCRSTVAGSIAGRARHRADPGAAVWSRCMAARSSPQRRDRVGQRVRGPVAGLRPQRVGPGRGDRDRARVWRATTPALRVLVADDNRDNADSSAMLLRMTGHEVRTAYWVAKPCRARRFRRCGILDLGIPGSTVTKWRVIAERTGHPRAAVAVTGWGQDEDRRRTAAAGFDHHLTKPVELDELRRLLASVPTLRPL